MIPSNFTNEIIPTNIFFYLEKNNLNLEDIDLFLFHQGSKVVIDSLRKSLNLVAARVTPTSSLVLVHFHFERSPNQSKILMKIY